MYFICTYIHMYNVCVYIWCTYVRIACLNEQTHRAFVVLELFHKAILDPPCVYIPTSGDKTACQPNQSPTSHTHLSEDNATKW